jgi:DNA polymerase III subunit delta
MRVTSETVARALRKPLPRAWLIAGDETLLAGEAADAVRASARAVGFTGRELFMTDRGFDWQGLLESARSLSLFAEKRIIEVRMPGPRPGKEGGAALASLAADPGHENLLLVVTTRPERDTWSSAWFKAFERHGVFVETRPVDIGRLPEWISARARRLGLSLDAEGAALLAERVEGNLLAAQQEIEKLALLHPGGRAGADAVLEAVANSARYDVYQLGEAALEAEAARAIRILDGLRAEGVEPPLVLWVLCRELRALAQERSGTAPKPYGAAAERHDAIVRRAVKRLPGRPLEPLFATAARIDREIKGISHGDPWLSLAALVSTLAGAELPAAPAA